MVDTNDISIHNQPMVDTNDIFIPNPAMVDRKHKIIPNAARADIVNINTVCFQSCWFDNIVMSVLCFP